MHNFTSYLIFSFVAFSLPWFLLQASLTTGSLITREASNKTGYTRIGAILDQTSRPGKEAKVAIEIAIHDLTIKTNQSSVLYLQNSRSKPVHTALAAKELIDKHDVQAILGAHTWEEASTIAEVITEADHHNNPPLFLSLAETAPPHATNQWPFFVQAIPSQSTQMNAVAAILDSWGIQQVTLIYETSHSLSTSPPSIISHLSQAFRQTPCELTHVLPLISNSPFLEEQLNILKKQQRKIFVIHTSLEFGIRLFQTAKRIEMTGDGYVWMATNGITDLFHSINSTVISSLQGLIGVKTYFPENSPEFQDFRKRFIKNFRSNYPQEQHDEPGIFAVQSYNAVKLLHQIPPRRKLSPASTVEIIHVTGKAYQSAYWSTKLGFSDKVEKDINGEPIYSQSLDNLGRILWPVQPWYAHRRRRNLAESSGHRMRVAVPAQSLFNQFVKVEFNSEKNEFSIGGFVIAVFEEMMKGMNLEYNLTPINGSYDDLVKQIQAEKADIVAGDVTILAKRHEFVDFTQPYTESGLEMIVPIRPKLSNREWLFMKPFTSKMWVLIAAITLYNGFIIWLIERKHNDHLRGSVAEQIGIIFWLAFTTLFTLRGDRLHSNLSRIAMVVWLFLALILTQSYTASLASMLTAERFEPAISSVEALRNMNATVGYCNGSFINDYLTEVLGFDNVTIKSYNSTHRYAEALNSGEIAAIFLEVPSAKVFLAQYCRSFIRTGETFKVGGFGFAFPKDDPRLSDANRALMNVTESRKLKELEDTYLVSEKCIDEESSPDEDARLSPDSFMVLFKLTGGISTLSLVIYIIISVREFKKALPEGTSVFKMISAYIKKWKYRTRRSSSLVMNAESPRSAPQTHDPWTENDTNHP